MATKKALPAPSPDDNVGHKIAEAILNFVGHIPQTDQRKSRTPDEAARGVATAAATRAAIAAGALALPPGPVGWLTVLPELIAVWKIQAKMVADIAAIYGKKAFLSREQMLYCLFRHMAAQAVRDFVAYLGERFFSDVSLCGRCKVPPRRLEFVSHSVRLAKVLDAGFRLRALLVLQLTLILTPARSQILPSSFFKKRSRLSRKRIQLHASKPERISEAYRLRF